MTRHRQTFALVLAAAALAACGDNGQTNITAPTTGAKVFFMNEAVGSPSVNFFADSTKLTAVLSSAGTVSPVGTGYGQAAAGGYYTQVSPGQHTLAARTADTTTGKSNLLVSSATTTLEDGKWYSYFQSGLYNTSTGSADAFVVTDAIPSTWDYSVANIRLVNAIYNANPGTLTLTNNDTTIHPTPPPIVIGGAVAYKTAGAFVAVPPGTYNVSITGLAPTGGAVGAIGLTGGRYYTLVVRGDMTVTSSKSASYPTVDLILNR